MKKYLLLGFTPFLLYGSGSTYYSLYMQDGGFGSAVSLYVRGGDYQLGYSIGGYGDGRAWKQKNNLMFFVPNGTKEFRFTNNINGSYKSMDLFVALNKIPTEDKSAADVVSQNSVTAYEYGSGNSFYDLVASGKTVSYIGSVGVEIKTSNIPISAPLNKWITITTSNKYYCDTSIARRELRTSLTPTNSVTSDAAAATQNTQTTSNCEYSFVDGWNLVGAASDIILTDFIDRCGLGIASSTPPPVVTTTSGTSSAIPGTGLPSGSSSTTTTTTGATDTTTSASSGACSADTYDSGMTWPVVLTMTLDKSYVDGLNLPIPSACAGRVDDQNQSVEKLCAYVKGLSVNNGSVTMGASTMNIYAADPSFDAAQAPRGLRGTGNKIKSIFIYKNGNYQLWKPTENTIGSTIGQKTGFWVNYTSNPL